jgi:AcrR family transcriptional regulator
VADEVGKSPMAVYKHFTSMDHLMASAWNEALDRVYQAVFDSWEGIADPVEQLRRRMRTLFVFGTEHPKLFCFILQCKQRPEDHGLENRGREGLATTMSLIQRGIAQGRFRPDLDQVYASVNVTCLMIGMTIFAISCAGGVISQEDPAQYLDRSVEEALRQMQSPDPEPSADLMIPRP